MILKKSLIFITIVCLVNSNVIAQSTDKTNGVFNTKPNLINKNHTTVIPIEIWTNSGISNFVPLPCLTSKTV